MDLFAAVVSFLILNLMSRVVWYQCDQIGQFIGLLATISKPEATISLPKSPIFSGNYLRCPNLEFFSEIIFGPLL